ncbi:MAG TPA: twin-arginine translocation signal domain-containing protein [Steroidobacteraceae bacterium]|nr:twin-arginine translocation signal domain-containing protein [Steroidobacteraceae bacterium]
MDADAASTGQPDRREFLKGATGVITGVLALGSPLALIAPSRVWAADLKVFSTAEGAALMAMTRTIAPHDQLEDAAYAIVVQSADADAAADPAVRKRLTEGIAALGPGFATAPEETRVAQLKKIEQTPFFQTMRVKTLSVLYATEMAYRYFGYEGEAYSKGGYLFRGFNDLRWLPEVPLADSGPVPAKA